VQDHVCPEYLELFEKAARMPGIAFVRAVEAFGLCGCSEARHVRCHSPSRLADGAIRSTQSHEEPGSSCTNTAASGTVGPGFEER